MKVTYLGTSAAEGFPAVFCNCENCKEARRLGGKNIRTRSQTLVNDDLLIDLPADTYMHFLNRGIEGDKIKYLFITHSHSDHLYPMELFMRHGCYAHDMRVPILELFCSKAVSETFSKCPINAKINVLKPFETVTLDSYQVTAIPARHMISKGEAFFYIIKGDKTLLYAHDTGYFYDEVFDYIKSNNIKLDMISLDCTNVDIPTAFESTHMGFYYIERVLSRLNEIGAISDATVKYVNHFSHNGNPLHHILESRAKEYDCLVSYDGCEINL